MPRGILHKILIAGAILLVSTFSVGAQAYSNYAPYSIFGFGDQLQPGTAYNKSMAGVGVAMRNNRFINVLNPAAVTARDSLAFMADISLYNDNKLFRQGDLLSGYNTFNINNVIISFPLYKSSAMMLGILPLSGTGFGYSFEYTDPTILSQTGGLTYTASGVGAVYETFAAAGVTFWKRLSLGVQGNFQFGKIEKSFSNIFTSTNYRSIVNGSDIQLNGVSAKLGIQYEQALNTKNKLSIGATYKTGTKFKGFITDYNFAQGTSTADTLVYRIDTLANNLGKVQSASEIALGLCYKYGDNFMLEFDYSRSDWTGTGIDQINAFTSNKVSTASSSSFNTSVSQAFRLGVEWTPNRNDVRYYYKRISYRAGAYYKTDYFKVDGHDIVSMGITIGATLPIFRWYNGLTLGMEIGQRGSLTGNLIKENYINFSIGVNIFDIWFQQPKYE